MKKLLISAGALVVLGIALVFVLVGNLDTIVKGSIEGVGSELLGTPVTVEAVQIILKSGSGTITGLTIANPAGYSAGNAFQMDMIKLGINLGSIGKQPLIIDELDIKSPVVLLEVNDDGSSNLQALMENMENNSAKADKKAVEQQSETKSGQKGEPTRIAFGRLAITGVTVQVGVEGEPSETVVIPDIEKQDLGREAGLTPGEIGTVIVGQIIAGSLENALEKKITEKIEEVTKGFFSDLKDKLTPEKNE